MMIPGFAISRMEKETIAMLKEDMWCYYPVIGLGLAEPPEYFLEGHGCYPGLKTLEACKKWAQAYPRLETGKYIGIVSAPLMSANFEPDVVILYCNSSQLGLMLMGVAYKDGHEITCKLNSDAACSYYIVPVIQRREYQLSMPCSGDKGRARAEDDEMVFSVPKGKLRDLMVGLRRIDEDAGQRIPRHLIMATEWQQVEPYVNLARMLGMQVNTP